LYGGEIKMTHHDKKKKKKEEEEKKEEVAKVDPIRLHEQRGGKKKPLLDTCE